MAGDEPRPPPPAPPLPPTLHDKRTKNSSFALKVRHAPEDWFYRPPERSAHVDPSELPTGPYFVYGTLRDPQMLADVLGLDKVPELRPAKVVGYSCKLWGQYPALQDGPKDAEVSGAVYHVQSAAHGKRLAEYETNSYKARPCLIRYTDGELPVDDDGHVFVFVGNPRDLEEGDFSLAKWREQVGCE
ncbi:poly polymerase [Fusarium flagelliforme]|uniref:Putative gamma-glutamylcyclotransferase n=1 Tax=Fusarium flagelliforme TaxID=2675880 RepID=A0A395MHG0_9HYPO|nr:poly polymerase [Fusarium flagelliforme]